MLNVRLNIRPINNPQILSNSNLKAINSNKSSQPAQNNAFIPFKGNAEFVMINKLTSPINGNAELNHISNILKTLGVKELEIGDNITLARLLKKAMYRVKMLGYDIPTRIKCESKAFTENARLREKIQGLTNKHGVAARLCIPGTVSWDCISEPILYLNTGMDWRFGNGALTKTQEARHPIWHETGHWLHMKKYEKDPQAFIDMEQIELNPYQKNIVRETIGEYAAENPVVETVAEIFARLMSGEAYDKLHPEVFHIYSKYNGPMPK